MNKNKSAIYFVGFNIFQGFIINSITEGSSILKSISLSFGRITFGKCMDETTNSLEVLLKAETVII